MKRFWAKTSILLLLVMLIGCSGKVEQDKVEVLFFTGFPTTLIESFEQVIAQHLDELEQDDVQVEIYPMSMEKVFVELTARHGDIYFIDKEYVHGLIDPIGLVSLDEIVEQLGIEELILEEYKDINPDTDQLSSYAIPITRHSSIMREIGIELLPSEELGAFVPGYSEKKDFIHKLLKELAAHE